MVGFSHPVLHIKYVATRKLHTYKCICTMFIPNPPIIECPKFVNDICWEWASKWANGLAWAPTRYQVLMTLGWDFAFSVMVGSAQGLKYPVDVQPWPEPYIKKRFMNESDRDQPNARFLVSVRSFKPILQSSPIHILNESSALQLGVFMGWSGNFKLTQPPPD